MTNRHRSDSWTSGPLVGFDLETGGVNVFTDRVVTACVVHVYPGKRPDFHRWLINSGVPIPAEAQAVHGISTEHAEAHGVEPASALFEITSHLAFALQRGVPVVAMNAAFDLSMLEAENHRHDIDSLASRLDQGIQPILDPFVLDRELDKFRKGKRRLDSLCLQYGLPVTTAHDSSADALMAVRIVQVIAQRYPHIAEMPLDELHSAQVIWHRERQQDFKAYLERQGKDASDVATEWPLRSAPKAVVSP